MRGACNIVTVVERTLLIVINSTLQNVLSPFLVFNLQITEKVIFLNNVYFKAHRLK